MKKAILHLLIGFILAAASPAWAADEFIKVTVTGTVQTQILLGVTEGRIRTTPMNNKRIFQEFGVSTQDYELVVKATGLTLLLVPKHTSAMLPQIKVIDFGAAQIVIDTKARAEKFQAEIIAGTATNVFKDVSGETAGVIHYKGDLATGKITKILYSVTARGTDPVGGNTTAALLKFKVTGQEFFVQQP